MTLISIVVVVTARGMVLATMSVATSAPMAPFLIVFVFAFRKFFFKVFQAHCRGGNRSVQSVLVVLRGSWRARSQSLETSLALGPDITAAVVQLRPVARQPRLRISGPPLEFIHSFVPHTVAYTFTLALITGSHYRLSLHSLLLILHALGDSNLKPKSLARIRPPPCPSQRLPVALSPPQARIFRYR